jgi:hypothetical protein
MSAFPNTPPKVAEVAIPKPALDRAMVWMRDPQTHAVTQFEAKDEILLPLMNQGFVQAPAPEGK